MGARWVTAAFLLENRRFLSREHLKLLPVSCPWLWGFRESGATRFSFCCLSFPSRLLDNRPQLFSCVEAASRGPGP